MKAQGKNINNQAFSPPHEAELGRQNTLRQTPVEVLQAQKERLEQQAQLIKELEQKNAEQSEQILKMQHQLDALLRIVYGKKSERFIATDLSQTQLSLFQSPPREETPSQAQEEETITYKRRKNRRKKPVRQALPEHLPRIEEVIEPAMDTSKMKRIGQEVTEILEVNPAKLWVRRIVRPKYAFVDVQEDGEIKDGVVVAPMMERPIPRIIAGTSMLALICVEKYVDHLPFYRQIQRYIREDIELKASTLNGWFVKICILLLPLYDALKKEVLIHSKYLQGDESTIKVQITQVKNTKNKKPPKGKTHTGQLWGYRNPVKNIAFFEYQTSRKKEHPLNTLKDFKGFLQTDDYGGYDHFDKHPDYIAVKCMAHARRKFNDARKENKAVASLFMLKIQQLYKIEEDLRNKRPDDQSQEDFYQHRKITRQQLALPILEDIKKLLDQHLEQNPPKRLTGKAIRYMLNNWDHLCIYAQHGMLEIDNNLIENLIRPIAIGRKNYLFAGSHTAAQRAAMMYSFFGVCKHHGVNPFLWLKDVLERISDYPINKVHELLPHHWKNEQDNQHTSKVAKKAED